MGWLRYLLYFLAVAIASWLLAQLELASPGSLNFYVTAHEGETAGTSEYSPIEFIQPLILACCAAIMGWVAHYCPSQRPLAIFFGAFAVAFLIWEVDYFLDRYIVTDLWRLLVGVIAALVIVYTYRNQRRLQVALARLWPSPGLALLFAGAVVLLAFVQCIGQERLWMSILGEDYRPVVKLAVEEFIELLGYFFWIIGSLEYAFQARSIAYREPRPAAQRLRKRRRHDHEGPY